MSVQKRSDFGFGMLFLALAGLFLFDPMVQFAELLPDMIGYLLLFVGLYFLADLCEPLAEAKHLFGILCGIGAAQIVTEFLLHVVLKRNEGEMNAYELPTAILLFSFLLLLVKLLVLIPAFRKLFAGLGYLAERTEGSAVLQVKRGRPRWSRMSRLCTVFVVASAVAALLPELTVLTSFETGGGSAMTGAPDVTVPFEEWFQGRMDTEGTWFDWFPYVSLFRFLFASISGVFGLVWLIAYIRFFLLAMKDRNWLQVLRWQYADTVLTQPDMLTVRRFRRAFLCFFFGALFTAGLRLSHYEVLPDFVFAEYVILGILCLGEHAKGKRLCYTLSIPLFLVSIAHLILNCLYLQKYVPMDSFYYAEAYDLFLAVKLTGALEALLCLCLMLALLRMLYKTICEHTGVLYDGEDSLSRAATERMHGRLRRQLMLLGVLFSLSLAGSFADAFLQVTLSWLWLVVAGLACIAVWKFLYFFQDVKEQIEGFHHSNGVNKSRF